MCVCERVSVGVCLVLVVTLAPGLFPLETPESFPLSTTVGVCGIDG